MSTIPADNIKYYTNRSGEHYSSLEINNSTLVFKRVHCPSDFSYAPDPLAKSTIAEQHEDRNKILMSLNDAFNRVNLQYGVKNFELDRDQTYQIYSKENTIRFISRLESFYPKSQLKKTIDFFELQDIDHQESILNWISQFRFENKIFLTNILNFLSDNPSQLDKFKLVLDSTRSKHNKIELINILFRDFAKVNLFSK